MENYKQLLLANGKLLITFLTKEKVEKIKAHMLYQLLVACQQIKSDHLHQSGWVVMISYRNHMVIALVNGGIKF